MWYIVNFLQIITNCMLLNGRNWLKWALGAPKWWGVVDQVTTHAKQVSVFTRAGNFGWNMRLSFSLAVTKSYRTLPLCFANTYSLLAHWHIMTYFGEFEVVPKLLSIISNKKMSKECKELTHNNADKVNLTYFHHLSIL